MDNQLIIADFVMHKECISRLLRNLTAINEDHLGFAPETLNDAHLGTIRKLQHELEKVAELAGLDAQSIVEGDD
ncbi:hypothetical protein GZ77_21265 [Endozoicomonas montiporae]|uniref:Uncharacterized protein n=2 Tax=Endozoicomonas montiporae TaxID=1027273 RepID=A0A081N3D7_9GAMM|nr:hypothetical protein [Endozoicomonas montiporae]AMO58261.1 hypothetical protein EZMO1_4344 [Endozoicomonas montiporae CL-33]KEQ12960.1 hypothetical protein GZ77_21265 [Endozoicomonas montiporae]